ncbi:DUF5060 domain-containing protein [Aquimarina rubra]|uniref:DUF5060 domain-containing protein n=1 Tax=Aquimarina rubra TaxID=1920033 RepID=A0ABW5LIS0_9FLAO
MKNYVILFLLLFSVFINGQTVTGELKKWHRITLSFDGPTVDEGDTTNPFRNYRMNVTFTGPSNQVYEIPGFFAADGNAANTSATSGNVWRAHFAPDEEGQWSYTASFRTGTDIAVSTNSSDGTPTSFDGTTGMITINATDKSGVDNRAKGRLAYINQRYLKFMETDTYFLKAGADSPENFLAYDDFDDTKPSKSWSPHITDWSQNDPVWQNDKGKGIIGAVNYLASKGMNVFSFLTMNVNGDGDDVWPWTASGTRDRFDVSKLAQWEILFDHADQKGMFLHFKTQETENDQLLNNGDLGLERKLYYRELIARFGHHLALNWNLGEENVQSEQQRKDMAQYFFDTDPYNHLIVMHTGLGGYNNYTPLLGNNSKLTGASLQTQINDVHNVVKDWVENSENAGKPWCVASDEIGQSSIGVAADNDYTGDTGSQSDNRVEVRGKTLYGTLLAGGHGVEYYFGYQTGETDLSCEDFRSRAHKWEDAKIALDFFHMYIPFWDMSSSDDLISNSNGYCFSKTNDTYLIYLPANQNTNIDIGNTNENYEVKWFDPQNGGNLEDGSITSLNANGSVSIGNPPNSPDKDWLVLLRNNTTLGNEDFVLDTFKMYPNPANSSFTIDGLKEGIYDLKVINATGQIIHETTVSRSKNKISTATLSTGIYFIKVSDNQNEISKKLIIN